ncbi:MAG: hypothetical protein OER21_10755 [Gemmatimonadota bacterium]|nr:hypothetical protein [Gemmatimonadota bacterium]
MATQPTYSFQVSGLTPVANRITLQIENGVGSGVVLRLTEAELYHRNTAAIVGIQLAYEIVRMSVAATVGTVLTADKFDTTDANLPAQVVVRSLPTGGTATGGPLAAGNLYTDETSPAPQLAMYANPAGTQRKQLTIRPGETIALRQGPFGTVGVHGIRIGFTAQAS